MSVCKVPIRIEVFDVRCDGAGCYERFVGRQGQTPEEVRANAKKGGWEGVWGRGTTLDICPSCHFNPGGFVPRRLSQRAVGTVVIIAFFLGGGVLLPALLASLLR